MNNGTEITTEGCLSKSYQFMLIRGRVGFSHIEKILHYIQWSNKMVRNMLYVVPD